ncbi:hypothetical protein VZT92_000981 [Zoarces viviparus]|uniref:Uncharacterized protein n=1 Tax=Zoarces viviparus TaxID=48416 RepID=A0AAW1G791_ZOAVI
MKILIMAGCSEISVTLWDEVSQALNLSETRYAEQRGNNGGEQEIGQTLWGSAAMFCSHLPAANTHAHTRAQLGIYLGRRLSNFTLLRADLPPASGVFSY